MKEEEKQTNDEEQTKQCHGQEKTQTQSDSALV
jgi:hypothetical protein